MTSKAEILGELVAAVQHREKTGGGGRVWRTIAAFDSLSVAKCYASGADYRVVNLPEGRGEVEVQP